MLYNRREFQTCDACFKHFEPILQKVMDNFNNVLTTLDPNSGLNVSEVSTKTSDDGKPYRMNYYNIRISLLLVHSVITVCLFFFQITRNPRNP